MEKREYAPGESGIITAEMKTDHYYGMVNKNIMVTTDSDTTPSIRLSFSVDIYADLRPLTTNLRFRNIVANQTYTQKVEIENNMGIPLEITKVEINKKMMRDTSYEINAKVEKSEGKEYISFDLVKKNLDYSFNNLSIPITVFTNSKSVKELQFYAIVNLEKPIEIDPSSIYMYSTKIGNKRVKRITVKSNTGKSIVIKEITTTSQSLSFEKVDESDTIKHIWVGVNEKAMPGRLNGIVMINIESDGTLKKLTVPVRGTIVK